MALPNNKNVLKRPSGGASLKSANANRSVGLPSRRVQQPVNIPEEDNLPQLEFDDGVEEGVFDNEITVDNSQIPQEASAVAINQPVQSAPSPVAPAVQPPQNQYTNYANAIQAMQQQQQIHNNASDANVDKSKKQPRKRYDRKKQSKIKKDETLTRTQARVWRYSIIIALVIFCLLGVKNAFIPPKSLTPAEVSSIAMQTMGETGFPMESGAAIAKTFAAAYIPINNDNAARAILANFYNGDKFDSIKNVSSDVSNQFVSASGGNITQRIKSGPYIFKKQTFSKNTANFVVGMLVYKTSDGYPITNADDNNSIIYKWVYLNIGIYYDDKKETFAIDKTSPSIVSAPLTSANRNLKPPENPDGSTTGSQANEIVTRDAKDAVINFMKAWGKGDSSALATLTSKNRTVNAANGLNGNYILDDSSSSLQFECFNKPKSDNYYRGLVTVSWKDNIQGKINKPDDKGNNKTDVTSDINYTSKYVLKIEKTSDGKYLIYDIHPYYYVPSNNN